ncbi:MAG: tRNA pseudouridine(38-40) synthase TruA [Rhodospirillales bacterium]|nr:tRNA pseudouridine(38-40) synthase TruA [Alphaproteobacteria bacterium]MCB9986678.1 tRNA pseudouridine(38-40) synthase TruA [Rhodospirillales bacterium]USO08594.1 MAG: tRNA pseudouridine(38-40) synthase TruA [Rhodospirillales bacterium]
MQRWKLTLEYDGARFYGWQLQDDNAPTVQGVLEDAIFAFCGQRVTAHVAGRTDAGVHARAQVCHIDLTDRPVQPYDLAKAINALVRPHALACIEAEPVGADFHARFSAKNKLYTYRILNRPAPPVTEAGHMAHHRRALDVDAMRAGAAHLIGHHDFTTFRDSACQAKSPEKTLDRLEIETLPYDAQGGVEIRIHAEARSFLHHQMRNMAGTLIQVGDGKWTPDDVKTALAARDRKAGGPTSPACGLYLVRVDY